MLALLFIVTLLIPQDARQDPGAPILRLTPGSTLTRRRALFCAAGYADRVRSVSRHRKDSVFSRYHVPRAERRGYVIDHSIPLELGGSNRITNLFPQDTQSARRKDRAEAWAKREACSGRQAVRPLQLAIAEDWRAVLARVPASFKER